MSKKGIMICNGFRVTKLDKLNVVVQKYVPSREVTQKDGTKKVIDSSWSNYSFHPTIQQAIKKIANEQINLVVEDGANAVIDKINELEEWIKNIKVVDFDE